MLYVVALKRQGAAWPVIAQAADGTSSIVTASELLVPEPQALFGVTVMLPATAVAVGVNVILFVVLVPVQPVGAVHV